MADAADKAHQQKEAETASGERLIPHATTTDGDRELRAEADGAEVDRVKAFEDTGMIAAPGTGDYHAARRAAKLAAAGGMAVEDPGAVMVDQVRAGREAMNQEAAQLRRAAGRDRREAPAGRRSQQTATTGTGDKTGGTGDKPASQSGDEGSGDASKATKTAPPAKRA